MAFGRVRGAMDSGINPWQLKDFEESLDHWISLESPDDDLRLVVTAWVLTRFDDPYQGVRREPGFANLWFGPIPGSVQAGRIVVCSYLITDRERLVKCNSFATLRLPL